VKLFLARKLVQRDLRGPGQDVAAQREGETTGPKVGSPEGRRWISPDNGGAEMGHAGLAAMRGRQARRLVIGGGPLAATTVDAAAGAYPTSIVHCQDATADLPSCLSDRSYAVSGPIGQKG
jgi:hypothetical protein